MKKSILFILLSLLPLMGIAQTPALDYSGDIYFIPSALTKSGESFLYTRDNDKFTVYDGDLNMIKSYDLQSGSITYKERVVRQTRKMDFETRELLTDWVVAEDHTEEITTVASTSGIELYTDDNAYHSRNVYLSQTLFDDDEDFEFIRTKYEIIPIETKTADYEKEHSANSGSTPIYNEDSPDAPWREYGADGYSWEWDEKRGKNIMVLEKTEHYGGLFSNGMEIVSMDGTVKGSISGFNYLSSAYLYRGNLYVRGHNANGSVLYRLNSKRLNYSTTRGDLNADGQVNAADHVKLSEIIMKQ